MANGVDQPEFTTRQAILDAIKQLQSQPATPPPSMSPEQVSRQRQLAVLSQLSGDKPLTTVGAQIFKDVEGDQARQEKFAEARNLANAQRLQGMLGVLSSEDTRREAIEQRREAAEARAEAARQARADRMTLAGMVDRSKPMQIVEGANGERYWADPRTQQIVGPVMVGGQPLPAKTKTLPESALKRMEEAQGNAQRLELLEGSFKPEYARTIPLLGGVEHKLGALAGTDASNWYKNYNNWKNTVRHGEFGAALTKYEQEQFDAANVNYNTPAEQIPQLLKQQADIFRKAYNRTLGSHGQAGFDVRQFKELPAGAAPIPGEKALTAQQRQRLKELRERAERERQGLQ